jgi:hypothetical protein
MTQLNRPATKQSCSYRNKFPLRDLTSDDGRDAIVLDTRTLDVSIFSGRSPSSGISHIRAPSLDEQGMFKTGEPRWVPRIREFRSAPEVRCSWASRSRVAAMGGRDR